MWCLLDTTAAKWNNSSHLASRNILVGFLVVCCLAVWWHIAEDSMRKSRHQSFIFTVKCMFSFYQSLVQKSMTFGSVVDSLHVMNGNHSINHPLQLLRSTYRLCYRDCKVIWNHALNEAGWPFVSRVLLSATRKNFLKKKKCGAFNH